MYLIYLGIENGYPLDQIYEDKVALISTERFRRLLESEENNENSKLDRSIDFKSKDFDNEIRLYEESIRSSQIFSHNASYEPIAHGPSLFKSKPKCIANLDFEKLSSYKSTER